MRVAGQAFGLRESSAYAAYDSAVIAVGANPANLVPCDVVKTGARAGGQLRGRLGDNLEFPQDGASKRVVMGEGLKIVVAQ